MLVVEKATSLPTLKLWGDFAMQAGLIPRDMNVYQAMAIIQAGSEMGLQPVQSLRSMNFIKGRLVMSVQLQLALAKQSGVKLRSMTATDASCTVVLERGNESVSCEYTVDDAKKAGLIKPDGNWLKYQRQMLRWRAIGDALRLIAPDLVMGLLSPEEAESIEPIPARTEAPAQVVDAQVSDVPMQIEDSHIEAKPERKELTAKQRELWQVISKSFSNPGKVSEVLQNHTHCNSFFDVSDEVADEALLKLTWGVAV